MNKTIDDIFRRAKEAENKQLGEIINFDEIDYKLKDKGRIGNLIQKYYFNIDINNRSESDFKELGLDLELKVTGLKQNKKKQWIAKERVSLSMIDFNNIEKDFTDSKVLNKNKNILLIGHEYNKDKNRKNLKIIKSILWKYENISENEKKIIENDYSIIYQKIQNGIAHELSCSDTKILEATTKGQGKNKDLRNQPNSDFKAKSRAFALKKWYVNYILTGSDFESINAYFNTSSLKAYNFLKNFINADLSDYAKKNNINTSAKQANGIILKKMLEEYDDSILELISEDQIKVRTMRLSKSGEITQESMPISSHHIKIDEILKENKFEDSLFYQELTKPYIIVTIDENIFSKKIIKDVVLLDGIISKKDINERIYKNAENIWKQTKLSFETINKGKKEDFILTKQKEDKDFHLRPKAKNSNAKNKYENSNLTFQAFWLNRKTISFLIKKHRGLI
ncbi:type II restriction enzyme Sau3AI, GATC site [Mesoplasma florum L1]|uniref:Type II restriction enzyme Sau3AI, GATC site n=1 Tax=Mesoplasma florum (strain ATCC 33453 / NBRC 100688 / NCTC 11704 / L1) TaxID=265311 RepID=Q6F1F9_MESFL|nr:MutH/Sau3AI family endonuclease [Mesoplasma florum]AAT75664.1 type II restriction enzyme Sau3AI, GATC site [Mesoplasma florum L1]